eukprot:TRINITY_DN6061_c0_g2_i1.p1 TRINITY_DN6061_c0_g2~~TRINITY_DN6061_c0_g2_i1.p1  ORF type:complete len:568 (-),score=89.56 TRINITY_DN6061_c0_g2_i1:4-1707(-)
MQVRYPHYLLFSTIITLSMMYYMYGIYGQFYTTTLKIVNSNACCLVLFNQCVVLSILAFRIVQFICLGKLRDSEIELLTDKVYTAIMDTLLSMTIFRDEFNTNFLGMFVLLLSVKMFHWLCQDRVDFMVQGMNRNPTVYLRLFTLMLLCALFDCLFSYYATNKVMKEGASVIILFAFEYAILAFSMMSIIIKYFLNIYDIQMDGRWDDKSAYVLYLDFVVDIFQLIVYIVFFATVYSVYGTPIHLIRQIWMAYHSFKERVNQVLKYRQISKEISERFPLATPELMSEMTDGVCIICRFEMDTGRILPCGHILHERCLQKWLQQDQSCPMDRLSVRVEDLNPEDIRYPYYNPQFPQYNQHVNNAQGNHRNLHNHLHNHNHAPGNQRANNMQDLNDHNRANIQRNHPNQNVMPLPPNAQTNRPEAPRGLNQAQMIPVQTNDPTMEGVLNQVDLLKEQMAIFQAQLDNLYDTLSHMSQTSTHDIETDTRIEEEKTNEVISNPIPIRRELQEEIENNVNPRNIAQSDSSLMFRPKIETNTLSSSSEEIRRRRLLKFSSDQTIRNQETEEDQ